MKSLCYLNISLICIMLLLAACNPHRNDYATTDYTRGLIKSVTWSGTAGGYAQGDTIAHPSPDTTHVPWAKAFHHLITDTTFAIQRVNGFAVQIGSQMLRFNTVDSAHGYVKFDTTVAGSGHDVLLYFYAKDSFSYEYHIITGQNAATGIYYETDMYLHTNGSH